MGLLARNPQHDRTRAGFGRGAGWSAQPCDRNRVPRCGHRRRRVASRAAFRGRTPRRVVILEDPGPWALVRHGSPTAAFPSGFASPEEVAAVKVRLGDREYPAAAAR